MAYTLDGTDLGRVNEDAGDSSAGLTPIALPDQDAADTFLVPTTGPVTKFNISGVKSGSLSDLQTFAGKLQEWSAKGGKLSESNLTYVSTLNGTFSVRVLRVNWKWVGGSPNMISYTMELIQGTFT